MVGAFKGRADYDSRDAPRVVNIIQRIDHVPELTLEGGYDFLVELTHCATAFL